MSEFDIDSLVRDPEFQGKSFRERREILQQADPENFGAMGTREQAAMLVDMKRQDWWQGGAARAKAAPKAQPKRGGFISETISNIPASAAEFGRNIYQAVRHPVETLENATGVLAGYGRKAGSALGGPEQQRRNVERPAPVQESMADATTQFFKGRYGGAENIANTVRTDPVGAAADISGLLTGGAGVMSKVPLLASFARPVATVGGAIDPIVLAEKATAPLARGAARVITKAAAPFKSRVTPDVSEVLRTAEAKGIPLSPADVSGSRLQALTETALSNIPSSTGVVQNFREAQLGRFGKQAVGPLTNQMGAGGKTFSEVGKSAQESSAGRSKTLDRLVSRKFDKARKLFPKTAVTTINENAPWRPSSFTGPGDIPTTGTQGIVRKIMQEEAEVIKPLKDTEAVSVLNELADTDSMSFSAVQRNLSRMKDIIRANDKGYATGGKFQSNSTAGAFKRIVRKLEDDVDSFAAEHGGEFEAAWHDARNTARAGYELFDSKRIRQVMNAEPSQLVNHFRTKNADSINIIKRAVGPRSFDQLRGAWIESLVKANERGQIRPASIGNALDKIDEGTLRAIFKPDELREIRQIGKLGQRLYGAEKVAGNPSGTAQSLASMGFYGSVVGMALSGNVPGAMATLFTPPAIAKLYLSKAGRKYLTEGFRIPAGSAKAAEWLQRGTKIIEQPAFQSGRVSNVATESQDNDPLGIR